MPIASRPRPFTVRVTTQEDSDGAGPPVTTDLLQRVEAATRRLEQAQRGYRRERRRANVAGISVFSLLMLLGGGVFFGLGHYSASISDRPADHPREATFEPMAPPAQEALASLEEENIALRRELARRREAVDDLYRLAARWVEEQAGRSSVAPPPESLWQGLQAEQERQAETVQAPRPPPSAAEAVP